MAGVNAADGGPRQVAPADVSHACDGLRRVALAVIGAGPAGIAAAVRARSLGVDALVVDEWRTPGGQVWREMPGEFRVKRESDRADGARDGERARAALAASGADVRLGHTVWSVARHAGPGYRIDAIAPGGPVAWAADAVIVATGTHERVIPFPGWTRPGVIGLAAATILLKSQRMLPGNRTVVAGAGPLLFAVAHAILKGGGEVAAVVDLAGTGEWVRRIPALFARRDLLAEGFRWRVALRAAGVPVLSRHAITAVDDRAGGFAVTVAPVDAAGTVRSDGRRRELAADCVCVGHGLVPGTEITRLLRARHRFDPAAGGWIADTDGDLVTSLPGLYCAGDGAGIAGALAASYRGELAGLAAARDLGVIGAGTFATEAEPVRAELDRAGRTGAAMASLMALRPGLVDAIAPATVVCRCEDVTRAEIEQALDAGARDVNQVKQWTRCGMGPCQGRMCGETVGSLVGARVGGRVAAGMFTGRTPLRPIRLDALTGEFRYSDIPLPEAAPL